MRRLAALTCVLAFLLAVTLPSVASAATTTTAQRNAISWTWAYNSWGNPAYNCLAYALGYTDRWVWPVYWGANPSTLTVDSWMSSMGHPPTSSTAYAKIICYGKNGYVTHFSRRTGSSTCRAKWGSAERFDHFSWWPYYSSSYGGVYRYYR